MQVEKKVSVAGEFVDKTKDIKDGDMVTIENAGAVITGQYGNQNVFKVGLPNGEVKNLAFNQTSMNNLIDAYGEDTEEWVNKEVRLFVIKAAVSGKMTRIVYLADPSWAMSEGDDGSIIFSPETAL